MKKLILMTALAVVLSVSAAHADYTGGGAVAPSSGSSASGAATDDATAGKQALKDRWDKFKSDHEQTWEKLEAERAAHWHGAGMNTASATDTASADKTGDAGAGAQDGASQGAGTRRRAAPVKVEESFQGQSPG